MGSPIGAGASFVAAIFYHIEAGFEESVFKSLSSAGYTNLYKALGQHDIVTFLDINDFEDSRLYSSAIGVRTSKPLAAYSFVSEDKALPDSPNISTWLKGAPVVGFVFLELDKWLYSKASGAQSSVGACSVILGKIEAIGQESGIELAVFGGTGKSELYVIVKSSKFEDIWQITAKCRELRLEDCFAEAPDKAAGLPVFVGT